MSKHSQLPWEVETAEDFNANLDYDIAKVPYPFGSNSTDFAIVSQGAGVAVCVRCDVINTPSERQANAELIVKAVNSHARLVEVLKFANYLLSLDRTPGVSSEIDTCKTQIRKIFAEVGED